MILQALKEYYDRKVADPGSGIAPRGWFQGRVDFAIVLNLDGTFAGLQPYFGSRDGKRTPFPYLLPYIGKQARKHTMSGEDANLLWDNSTFVLGLGKNGPKKLTSFIGAIRQHLAGIDDPAISAVLKYLEDGQRDSSKFSDVTKDVSYGELIREGRANVTFRINADSALFVFERPHIKARISAGLATSGLIGTCMVTGKTNAPIEENHLVIKGLYGAKKDPNVVSFNEDAYRSFGKNRGDNAPVSMDAAFAYTTALNHLTQSSGNRMPLGDATMVYWSEKETECSKEIEHFFGSLPQDNPDKYVPAVQALFKSVNSGAFTKDDLTTKFFVLGMTPFGPRIAIRSWTVETIKVLSEKICTHFVDTDMEQPRSGRESEPRWLSLNGLLAATAIQVKKYDPSKPHLIRYRLKCYDVTPNLEADMMRSILEGLPYPHTLLQGAIRRIRAEQEITYSRAALIKACLNRSMRFNKTPNTEEMKVSLDPGNTNIGYRLGRLFATMEQIQTDANRGRKLNATIRKRYYGAASSTPSSVFGTLLNKLNPHHIDKLKEGLRIVRQRTLREIIWDVDGNIAFPATLSLEDQGRFAIGYYHQMQDFSAKKTNNNQPKGEQI